MLHSGRSRAFSEGREVASIRSRVRSLHGGGTVGIADNPSITFGQSERQPKMTPRLSQTALPLDGQREASAIPASTGFKEGSSCANSSARFTARLSSCSAAFSLPFRSVRYPSSPKACGSLGSNAITVSNAAGRLAVQPETERNQT